MAATATRRGFHCNIVNLPETRFMMPPIVESLQTPHNPPEGGLAWAAALGSAGGEEAGFGERATPPGELLAIPAGQRRHRDALPRGVDHPARAEVDAGVADRVRPRPRTVRAEEED